LVNHSKELGKNSFVAMIGLMINGPVMFAIGLILARYLGDKGFGLYTLAFTIATFGSAVGTFGLHFGVFRYVAHYSALGNTHKARTAFNILSLGGIIGGVLVGCLLYFSSEVISTFFAKEDLQTALRIMALLVPLLCTQQIFLYALRGLHKIPAQATIEKMVQPLLRLALFASVLFLGFGVVGVFWSLVIGTAITALIAGRYVLSQLPKSTTGTSLDYREIREWFIYSLPVFAEIVLKFLLLQTGIEVFILGKYVSEAEIGIYGAIYRLLPLMMVPALAFSSAFGPIVAECFAPKDMIQLRKTFSLVSRLIVILTLPLFFALVFFSSKILGFFGPGFERGGLALAILACGFLVDAGVGEVRTIVLLSGRSGIYLINTIVLVTMSILLSLLLIPIWGIVGAAIAASCSRATFNLIGIVQVFWFTRIHPFAVGYFKPWLAGVVVVGMFFLGRYLFNIDMASLLTGMILYGGLLIIYAAILSLLGLSEEKKVFWAAVKRSARRAA